MNMAKVKQENRNKSDNKGGRPTNFKEEYTDLLIKFFDIEPYKKEITEKSEEFFQNGGVKKKSEKYAFKPEKMPTLYRFARKIGVDYTTVWRWSEKGETMQENGEWQINTAPHFIRFCNAYKEAKEMQKEFLITIGLAGAAPSPFAIFTAKNVTDMRDKNETDITSKGEQINTITDDQADRILKRRIAGIPESSTE